MVANSTPGGCSSGQGGCAPRFPWRDMVLLCFVMVGVALAGVIAVVTASATLASGLGWLGYRPSEGSAYLWLFAFLAATLAMWRTWLFAVGKVQAMRWSSTFLSRGRVLTYAAASAVAVAMGMIMWWLTRSSPGWHAPGVDHALWSAVTVVLIPVVLVWVVAARFVHKWVSK